MHRQNRIDKNNVQAAKMPASHTQEPASGQDKRKKADTPPQEVKKNSTGGLNGLLSGIFPDGKLDNEQDNYNSADSYIGKGRRGS